MTNKIPTKVVFTSEKAKELYNGILKYETPFSSGFDLKLIDIDIGKYQIVSSYDIKKDICHFSGAKEEKQAETKFSKDYHKKVCLTKKEYGNNVSFTLEPGCYVLIQTGIKISVPQGYETQIRPRSGFALKHGISIVNSPGTVDSDYRGEIGVILINHGREPFTINIGERIAQAVICPVVQGEFEYVDKLDETDRGTGGFGSTGTA